VGMYDIVVVPCPTCGEPDEFQSKSGRCTLETYALDDAPDDVLLDVNRHGPSTCRACGTLFGVVIEGRIQRRTLTARSVVWNADEDE